MRHFSIDPALPVHRLDELSALSRDIFVEAGALSAALPHPVVREAAASLVRAMNSYYSNLIEGHKTLPKDIERALRSDFERNAGKKFNQQLAIAHIKTEDLMVERLRAEPELNIHARDFICWLHKTFFDFLPADFHKSKMMSGREYEIIPGALRSFDVQVGGHTPPPHNQLERLLMEFETKYSSRHGRATDALIAVASAHHRLAWIHPFGDGNGRVARLYSHAALMRERVDSLGLWTLARGFARLRPQYYRFLADADKVRRNDVDGRGPLSSQGLADFCVFFLETALDQIRFMAGLFDLSGLSKRIEDYLRYDVPGISRDKERLALLIKASLREGPIPRSRVPEIVGLKPSAARKITALALAHGLMSCDTPKGPVTIAFPAKVLESYFPRLFLDLSVE
jgi:Fic family protein